MTDNPFEPPKAKVGDNDLPASLAEYTPAQVKKLYYRSCNVNGIAFLLVLGAGVIAAAAFVDKTPTGSRLFFLAMLAFYAFAIFGTIKRTSWGRALGIICCCLMLINVPIGTIIGVIGLFAFIKAKELFGPERVTHAEVKRAFKDLKSAKAF